MKATAKSKKKFDFDSKEAEARENQLQNNFEENRKLTKAKLNSVKTVDSLNETEAKMAVDSVSNGRSDSVSNDVASSSESDVPDVEGWMTKSRKHKKPATTLKQRTKKEKQTKDETVKFKKKAKDTNSRTANDVKSTERLTVSSACQEFESGLELNGEQSRSSLSSSMAPSGGGDRDFDSDDADILDCVASGDWTRVKTFEQHAKAPVLSAKEAKKTRAPVQNLQNVQKRSTPSEVASKHVSDNRKRLESVKKRCRENEKQSSIVSAALQTIDVTSPRRNRIVFDSDGSESSDDEQVTSFEHLL